ncbi:hypothetical protein [Sphingosinicella sp. CPCC 101087]|uniref:hypothetical protein n=1 Tax=Sphingosinicella sp. CPCC 101087 TaxID=2497754 RepID=UPI00101D8CA0|nr:hypothetical protein [Sphingosinicella sp. CPCC 101087]
MRKRDSAERFRPSRRRSISSSGEAGISGRAPLPILLLAAIGALLLGWVVVRVSAANALIESRPAAAPVGATGQAEAQLELARAELQLAGTPSEETVRSAHEAFRRLPLSDVPLLIGVRRAMDAGEDDKADRLLAMAARRNPRSRYTLLLELDQHVRRGRTAEAAETIAVLTRFFPEVGDFLVGELGRMAGDPASRGAVRKVMETDPRIRTSVLEQLAREGADPDLILALAGPQGRQAARSETPRWQRLMLDRMVERGRVDEALRVWTSLVGVDPAARAAGIYDAEFRALPGPPPFNWDLELGSDGFAERDGSGGLHVQYYGRGNAVLASQLLTLAPGTYEVGFDVEGEADGEHGQLAWTVTCHPGGGRLVAVPITGVDFASRRLSGSFTVPASGCLGQWLRLVGTAAEFPEDQQVTVTGLRIAGAETR